MYVRRGQKQHAPTGLVSWCSPCDHLFFLTQKLDPHDELKSCYVYNYIWWNQIHYILAENNRSWAESGGRPSTTYAEKDRQWMGLAGWPRASNGGSPTKPAACVRNCTARVQILGFCSCRSFKHQVPCQNSARQLIIN
jgi:hypothetical protein